MKFNPKTLVLDYEGKSIKNQDNEDVTYREVVSIACNSTVKDEQLTAEDKVKAFQITSKVFSNDKEVELNVGQISFVLERIKKIYSPLVVGRALEFFDTLPKE